MSIERAELDALFNSSNNDIEDERVKLFDDRSKQSNKDMDDLEKSISSRDYPSILEEATSINKVEDFHESNDINLNDLNGSEELNIKTDKKQMTREEIVADELERFEDAKIFTDDIDQPIIEDSDDDEISLDDLDEDDEISLDDLDGDKSNIVSKEIPQKSSSYRVPFDFDGEEVDSIDNIEKEVIEERIEEKEVVEDNDKDGKKSVLESYPQEMSFNTPEQSDSIKVVCTDEKYLNDPRYLEFYRQKLRAYNFLQNNVPRIDYKKLRNEMKDFYVSVNFEGVISLDQFNEKIQKVQSIRNRLTKIKSLCIQNYVPTKRVVKMLEDCLMKESLERSSDKRSGDIQIHMCEMEYDLAMSEAFLKDVEQIMENITSAHEALSRQITVLQERNREIQRGQEPYMDRMSDKHDSIIKKDGKNAMFGGQDISERWEKEL